MDERGKKLFKEKQLLGNEKSELMEENSELRDRVSTYDAELQKLRSTGSRYKRLEEQFSRLETQLKEQDEDKDKIIESAKEEQARLGLEINQLIEENTSYQGKINEYERLLAGYESQVKALKANHSDVGEMKKSLADRDRQMGSVIDQVKVMKSRLTKVDHEDSAAMARARKLIDGDGYKHGA